jgi:AcrR family transcriptional regulator
MEAILYVADQSTLVNVPEHPVKSSTRSASTREKIVTTAEQLFFQYGVAGVSINTINQAAKQKNKNAVHYHFGGKEALLQAIFDKHTKGISARRQQILESNADQPSLHNTVKALVIPVAEKLSDPDGGQAFIRISAELSASNTLSYYQPTESTLRISREDKLAQMITQELSAIPQAIIEHRMILAVGLLFHSLSDHCQLKAANRLEGSLADTDLMIANLINSIVAILSHTELPVQHDDSGLSKISNNK